MRRLALFLVLLIILPFTSCAPDLTAMEQAVGLQGRFQTTHQLFTAEVRADYGDRFYEFSLRFDSTASTIEVLAPESIAGIVISVADGGTVLHFEGAEINTGSLTPDGLSPLAAIPTIAREWRSGRIVEAHFETMNGNETLVMTTEMSDTVRHKTWFNRETGIPILSKIFSDGFAVIRVIYEGSPLSGAE